MTELELYIFTAAGLIALSISVLWPSTNSHLKKTGIPVDGIVFKQGSENTNSSSFDNSFGQIKDKITVRFVTHTGEWITDVIKQDFKIFFTGQYKNGDSIKVYYNKENPSDFYVDTKQSELAGRLVLGLVGLIFLMIGLYQLFVVQ